MFPDFCASGLEPCSSWALSWSEKEASTGVRRWLSLRAGGELLFAWFSRSSAARSLASRASSSLVCVVTAYFLGACQSTARGEMDAQGLLL